jgi:voltage-gated potassium channel
MNESLRHVRRGATLLGAVFCVAVVGHKQFTGDPWLESIYWAVITLSGVGYTQETPASVGPARQLLTIVVILVGMTTIAYTFGVLFIIVIQGQIDRVLGVRRMSRLIEQLKHHTIVCGFGHVGRNLVERLRKKKLSFVVVDSQTERVAEASALGYLTIEGDATDEEVLKSAGIDRAKTVVVALRSDADNVFLTLTARNLNTKLNILARCEQPNTEKKLRQAGANHVVMPAIIGAQRIADIISKPHAADLLYRVADPTALSVDLEELQIPKFNRLIGKTIRSADLRQHHQLLIIAIRREDGQLLLTPEAEQKFHAGDTIIVLGQEEGIAQFRQAYDIPLAGGDG